MNEIYFRWWYGFFYVVLFMRCQCSPWVRLPVSLSLCRTFDMPHRYNQTVNVSSAGWNRDMLTLQEAIEECRDIPLAYPDSLSVQPNVPSLNRCPCSSWVRLLVSWSWCGIFNIAPGDNPVILDISLTEGPQADSWQLTSDSNICNANR